MKEMKPFEFEKNLSLSKPLAESAQRCAAILGQSENHESKNKSVLEIVGGLQ